MKASAVALGILLVILPFTLAAEVAAVHRDKLPQTTTVLAAYDDAQRVEHCADHWMPKWNCDLDKDDVAATLGKDLGFLQLALKDNSSNQELHLLAALVAHYAYNLDVQGAYDSFQGALDLKNNELQSDFRAGWFRADFECQLAKPSQGMERFLELENKTSAEKLPAMFWANYTACSTLTIMPAHSLRAIDHWKQVSPVNREQLDFYSDIAKRRYLTYDPAKKYEPQDTWSLKKSTEDTRLTSSVCSISAKLKSTWQIQQALLQHGTCVLVAGTEFYQAGSQKWRPSVMILAEQQSPGETLADFEKIFLNKGNPERIANEYCPASQCDEFRAVNTEGYGDGGYAIAHILFFERSEPQYPGLLIETPADMPDASESSDDSGLKYYHPVERLHRFTGTIYYMILLDTAEKIEKEGDADYLYFLKKIVVE